MRVESRASLSPVLSVGDGAGGRRQLQPTLNTAHSSSISRPGTASTARGTDTLEVTRVPSAPYTEIRSRRLLRQKRLRQLGYADYPAYLRSPHWQRIRALYKECTLEPQDCICGATEGLHLHHMTYERIGAENLGDLTPLCANCHNMIHVLEQRGEIGLDFRGFVSERRAARYQEAQQPLEERRSADFYSPQRAEDAAKRTTRSMTGRLRHALCMAYRNGHDPSSELVAIDRVVSALEMRTKYKAS